MYIVEYHMKPIITWCILFICITITIYMAYTPFKRIHMIPPGFQYHIIPPKKYPTIMHLVLFSHGEEYDEMYNITKQYYQQFHNVTTIYYTFSESNRDAYQMDGILYLPGEETYIPGILDKTIKAFEFVKDKSFDYLIRSNVSTIINFNNLSSIITQYPITVGGGMVYKHTWGGKNHERYNTIYPHGTSMILSKPMLMELLDEKDQINYNIIDDLEIGHVLEREYPSLPFYSFQHYFAYVDEKTNMDQLDYKNIIFYRNKSEDRKQDIQNMKEIVYRLS